MAVWQFSFEFVPVSAQDYLRREGRSSFKEMDEVPELSDDTAAKIIVAVDALLPRSTSLSEMIDIWGDEAGITVQHWHPGGIRVRVHAANYGPSLADQLRQLLDVARSNELLILLLDDLRVVNPELPVIEQAIYESRSSRWTRGLRR